MYIAGHNLPRKLQGQQFHASGKLLAVVRVLLVAVLLAITLFVLAMPVLECCRADCGRATRSRRGVAVLSVVALPLIENAARLFVLAIIVHTHAGAVRKRRHVRPQLQELDFRHGHRRCAAQDGNGRCNGRCNVCHYRWPRCRCLSTCVHFPSHPSTFEPNICLSRRDSSPDHHLRRRLPR